MDTFCWSLAMKNKQRKNTNITYESQMSLDILEEMIKGFKVLTLQSTINDSEYYNSDKDDAESNPKSD